MTIIQLVRPNILALQPYHSARSEFKGAANIFLDANENPYNTLGYNRYPDPLQLELKKQIAQEKKLHTKKIFCGNGSDEAIDILLRIFCEPKKDSIIILPPTYGIYKVYANIANVNVIEVPLSKDFQLQPEHILKKANASSKLLFINYPNNPTGNLFQSKDILFLIQNFKGIVVVDEAYIDFANVKSHITQLAKYPNLVVLQTFSKALGLAGLRIGTAFASEEIIDLMNKVKAPYNINTFTQHQALKALVQKNKTDRLIAILVQEKAKLIAALSTILCVKKVYPSATNYVLVEVNDANAVYDYLIQQGIVVRNRTKDLYCNNCLRITIGTPKENKALLATLKRLQ